MRKLSLFMLCVGVLLVVASNAHARGGTYNRAEPVFIPTDGHKTHRHPPVVVYSPAHRHYHLTYHPQQ